MSQNKIQVISTSLMKVESDARFNLTPSDLALLFIEYIQMGLLFWKPTPHTTTGTTSFVHHLKASLQQTLHFFPPLAGRIAKTKSAEGVAFFIDCNHGHAGALFVHASDKHHAVADIVDSSTYVPEIVQSFFPLTRVRSYDGVARPVLGIQVTELVDGFFIGCSMNHLAGDGKAFWHFINSWAQLSRGEVRIHTLPVLNRDEFNSNLAGSKRVHINDELIVLPVNNEPRVILRDCVFHFTKGSLAKLKARANQEMVESEGNISSLQAVIAHLWRSIIRCRMNSCNGETTFEIPLCVRRRMHPTLPSEFFGTAIIPGLVTLEARKIVQNSLGWTALQIHRMVASYSHPDKVKEFYVNWMKRPKFLNSYDLPRNYFVLINSPLFDVYGNDFGWGKPLAIRSGLSDRFDGRLTIYGGAEEGSIDVEMCLLQETLSALRGDSELCMT